MKGYQGFCYHALQHKNFPYKRALKVFEGVERPALSFLWSTFGNKKKGIKHFIDEYGSDRSHLVQVHLMNHVCVRHGNCRFPGEIAYKLSPKKWNMKLMKHAFILETKIRARVKKIRKVLERQRNVHTKLCLVVALEDNLNNKAAKRLIEIVKMDWPYDIVRNPVGHNPMKKTHGVGLELHGVGAVNSQAVEWFNLDGQVIDLVYRNPTISDTISIEQGQDFMRKGTVKGKAAFLWDSLHQGIHGNTTSVPPPRKRVIEVPNQDIAKFNSILKVAQ